MNDEASGAGLREKAEHIKQDRAERYERIRTLHRQGYTSKTIAARTRFSRNTVTGLLTAWGLTAHREDPE